MGTGAGQPGCTHQLQGFLLPDSRRGTLRAVPFPRWRNADQIHQECQGSTRHHICQAINHVIAVIDSVEGIPVSCVVCGHRAFIKDGM